MVDYHRGTPSKVKSVWESNFNFDDEINCFINTIANTWVTTKNTKDLGWGLNFSNGINSIGVGVLPGKKVLYFAQFKKEQNNTLWHGYPIDYTNINQRIPDEIVETGLRKVT